MLIDLCYIQCGARQAQICSLRLPAVFKVFLKDTFLHKSDFRILIRQILVDSQLIFLNA